MPTAHSYPRPCPTLAPTSMDLFQRPHKKRKVDKDGQNSSWTPTASAVPDLIQASTSIATSHTVNQDTIASEDRFNASATPTTRSGTNEQARQQKARKKGSKADRWLARAALMLSLTKSIADAVEFAPLKGACEAVVTLLESIQVRFNDPFLSMR